MSIDLIIIIIIKSMGVSQKKSFKIALKSSRLAPKLK